MSRVDFYILSSTGEISRQQFACRLAEKAYKLDNQVHILVGDQEGVRRLDDLLWTFRDGSFVPHEVVDSPALETNSPVTIGCAGYPDRQVDLLINLDDAIPRDIASFPRVAEVVTSDEDCKILSRQRFVEYRDQGHTLDTHNL